MEFYSTRNHNHKVSSIEAIKQGIAKDGGLYLPTSYLHIFINEHLNDSYEELASFILSYYFDEFDKEDINNAIHNAYSTFTSPNITPITKVGDDYILELWHGPTCAFKDIALEVLPHLLSLAIKKSSNNDSLVLVATSGDTGKAALVGFKDVAHTKVMVFYPSDGVSDIQKRQMTTSEGENVKVIGVRGNFDDCQKAVKKAMTSYDLINYLNDNHLEFSSANSINIARLLPQVVYYFYSYITLVNSREIKLHDKVNFTVPTGNFGNILAAYIASLMGLPINKLIIASNANHILSDFINDGIYDTHREFLKTLSPSMDIIVSSNLERLLSLLINDDKKICDIQNNLKDKGVFEIDDNIKDKLNEIFYAGYANDNDIKECIKYCFYNHDYLLDPHTAVAYKVMKEYINESHDEVKNICLATASPYKFTDTIMDALGIYNNLEEYTNTTMPNALKDLENKEILHKTIIDKEDIIEYIKEHIND